MGESGVTDPPVMLGGRYLLQGEVGRGGMSVVHRAHDVVLQRPVAVKVLRDPDGDPAVRSRFDDEARILAGLHHPGLTRMYDAGVHEESPFLVMEFVDGETLTERCHRLPMACGEVATVGVALAETLRHVHERGVVHRDLKPSNVLLGSDGRVRLADFGIARSLSVTGGHPEPGLTLGTAAYLSPEQVRGHELTTAGDVYSLALVLLEALSGRPTYTGTPDAAALARLTSPPILQDTIPAPLRTLLRTMTAPAPADRPSAGDVAAQLQMMIRAGVLAGAVASARHAAPDDGPVTQPTAIPRPPPPAVPVQDRRSGRAGWLVVAASVVAVTALVVPNWPRSGAPGPGVAATTGVTPDAAVVTSSPSPVPTPTGAPVTSAPVEPVASVRPSGLTSSPRMSRTPSREPTALVTSPPVVTPTTQTPSQTPTVTATDPTATASGTATPTASSTDDPGKDDHGGGGGGKGHHGDPPSPTPQLA